MMNKYFSFVIIAIVLLFLLNLSDGQVSPKLAPIIEECKKAEKISDSDLAKIKNNTLPRTKEMKCFGACISEKTGQIVDKKLNNEGVLAYFKTLPTYSEQLQKGVTEIVAECKNIQDADRCELGDKLKNCMMEGAKKRGIQQQFEG